MAQYTASDWATQVLSDIGAPTSQNNINNILHWMVAEEPGNDWFDRNNPLNASLNTGTVDGTGSYGSLTVGAQNTAAMIKQSNMSGILQALQNNASINAFSAAVVASPWASSHYGGDPNHIAETNAAEGSIAAPTTAGSYSGGSSMSAADWQALAAAGAAGGTQYLTSLAAGNQSATSTAAASGATGAAAQGTEEQINIPGLGPESVTGQQASAYDTIVADAQAYGLNAQQSQSFMQWAWGEITNNVDPTQIALDFQTPGTQGYQIFEQVYPGFTGANAQLLAQGLPAVSVQQYAQYQTQAQAMAQAAGLPPGFLNSQNIGTLIGGNVSTQELSSRINNALTLAYNSTPEQQETFNQYFGANYGSNNPYATGANTPTGSGALTPGQIAAIALDPSVAEPLIAQQITAGQIGGASVTSGVGALSAGTASQLAQAGITESQATSAFQNLAPYSTLEQARPGMGAEAAQGVVTAGQLATGALLGNTGAQRQLQTAEEVAKAPFAGGGGFVSNAKGATGTGSASDVGAGNT